MKKILFVGIVLIVGLITGVISSIGSEDKGPWPVIQAVKESFHFVDHRDMEAKLKIVDQDGIPLYLLECYLNAYDHQDRDFDYSGDFECRLTSLYSKDAYSTLLTEEKYPTRDWQSRGRFLVEELTGKCAEYPEYGRVRHFKLRGMYLTLEIRDFTMEIGSGAENIPWNRDRIKELNLDVVITSDANALSEIAERTKYIEPPRRHPADPHDLSRNCETVLMR